MSRKPRGSSERLARLQKALEIVKGSKTLNLGELARAVGVSDQAMGKEIKSDPKFPVTSVGSNGVGYVLPCPKALKYLIAKEETKLARQADREDLASRLAGIQVSAEDIGSLSITEMRAINAVQMDVQKRKIEQGHYVRAADHRMSHAIVAGVTQRELLGLRAVMDPSGHWDPVFAENFDEQIRTALVRIRDEQEKELRKQRGSSAGDD